ncbi:MAG: IPT/TIG domain-containing protein, partial [Bacteroidota bacterium]
MQNFIKLSIFIILILHFFSRCSDAELDTQDFPFMIMEDVTVSTNGAALRATVTTTGGQTTSSYGFVYGNNIVPTLESDESFEVGKVLTAGTFSRLVTSGLSSETEYYVRPYAIVDGLVIYGTERFFISLGSPAPDITGISPTSAEAGATVEITGRNFALSKKGNLVKFGSISTTVDSATSVKLYVKVPLLETSEPVNITVETARSRVNSPDQFTLKSAWLPIGVSNVDIRSNATSIVLNGTAYVINDTEMSSSAFSFTFDGTPESIERFVISETANQSFSTAFQIGNRGYIVMGDQFFELNPNGNTLVRKADFPGKELQGNTLYSLSLEATGIVGFYGNSQRSWSYDPTNDRWTELNALPLALAEAGNAANSYFRFTIDGRGFMGFRDELSLWEYNPVNDSWTQKSIPEFPITPAPMIINNQVFVGYTESIISEIPTWY